MTSRRAGLAMVVLGVMTVAWAWFGGWPLAAPVYGPGPDYDGLHGFAFGVAIGGAVLTVVGVFLFFAGRGGPDTWTRP